MLAREKNIYGMDDQVYIASVERLALRKVPRVLNYFKWITSALWYCSYSYFAFDLAYDNSCSQLLLNLNSY